jgi:hypothetical protein
MSEHFVKDVPGQRLEVVEVPYQENPQGYYSCKHCNGVRANVHDIEYHCRVAHGIWKERRVVPRIGNH